MASGFYFPLSAIAFCLLTIITFFAKGTVKTIETKIYKYLIITNLIGLIIEILCTPAAYISATNPFLSDFILKLYLVYNVVWTALLTSYVFYVSVPKNIVSKYKKVYKYIANILLVICTIVIYYLECKLVIKDNFRVRYTEGASVNFTYTVCGILIGIIVLLVLFNYKSLKNKKYIPIYIFLVAIITGIIIQKLYPGLLIMTYVETLTIAIMFHTIENPDVKVIDELNKNKLVLEKNNEDRSNFMFRITQEVKRPITNIDSLAGMIDAKDSKTKDIVSAIKSNTRFVSYVVNDALDVSNVDVKNIKIVNNTYNIKRLFDEVNILTKEQIKNDVIYSHNISRDIPNELYGDSIKLKQVIMSVLNNSISNTKKGFIELNIDVIKKYDMCRLIITIEDSGCGMDIRKVNDILTSDKELDKKDLEKLNNLDVDLDITKKIVNLIGGSMMIKSEVNHGTEVIITIDQQIVKEEDKKMVSIKNDIKKILIVEDDIKLLEQEKKYFENNGIEVVGSMYGNDIIGRLRNKEEFDLIIIDDKLTNESGIEILDSLKENSSFDTAVIIMLEKEKEIIKKHYVEKGFKDYLLKTDLENEINRICKNYLEESKK